MSVSDTDDGTPSRTAPEHVAAQISWLEREVGQQKLARATGVSARTLRNWKNGGRPRQTELRLVHDYAVEHVPGYPAGAGVEPLWSPPAPPSPAPRPGRPVHRRRRWLLAPAAGAVVAVMAVVWLLTRGPAVAVVTPAPGDVAGDGSPLDGRLDGDLPGGWSVWGATLSPEGRYYPQDHPCDVAADGGATCDPLYVGRDEASGERWQVCLLVVSDDGPLRDYAARPDPRGQNPGLADPPSATEAQDCVAVVN